MIEEKLNQMNEEHECFAICDKKNCTEIADVNDSNGRCSLTKKFFFLFNLIIL